MGPTCVTVADANAQEIKISFNMPSREGVKTIVYSLDKSRFSQMIEVKVQGVLFENVLDAYQDSQTQSNEVATLRPQEVHTGAQSQTSLDVAGAQEVDNSAQQQAGTTEGGKAVLAAESSHKELVAQLIAATNGSNQGETKGAVQNSR